MRFITSCSVVWTEVAAKSELVVAGTAGFWVEIGGVTGWDVDDGGDTSVSLVVRVFSDVAESLVVAMGTAVDTVTVVREGTGSETVTVVRPGAAVVLSASSVTLAVVSASADVEIVVRVTPEMVVVVSGLGVTDDGARVVDLMVTVGDLVAMVTLAVIGLTVDL